MPTLSDLLESARARRRQERLAAEAEAEAASEQSPGLLATIGRTLDYPRRKAWEAVGAGPESTGREVLEKAGMLGPNKPGFDLGDVAGFGLEVVGDPLTYVGGVGVLTKGGKALKALKALKPALSVAKETERTALRAGDFARILAAKQSRTRLVQEALGARRAAKEAGMSGRLGRTLAEQGARGERQLFGYDVPFTRLKGKIPVPGEGLALGALGRAGVAAKAIPGVSALAKTFATRSRRLGEAEGAYEVTDRARRRAEIGFEREVQEGEPIIGRIAAETESEVPEVQARLYDALESVGVPEKLGARAAEIMAKGQEKVNALRRAAEAARARGAKVDADRIGRQATEAAQELRQHAADVISSGSGQDLYRLVPREILQQAEDILRRGEELSAETLARPLAPGRAAKLGADVLQARARFMPSAQRLIDKAKAERALITSLPAEGRSLVERSAKSNAEILRAQQAAGVPISALTDPELGYARALLTPEGRVAKKAEGSFIRAIRENTTKTGAEIKRVEAFRGLKRTEINRLLNAKGGPQRMFSEDPVLSTAYRRLEGERSIAAANLARGLTRRFGRAGVDGMPAAEFFERAGVKADARLAHLAVPHDVAETFLQTTQKLSQPHEIDRVFNVLAGVRQYYSKLLLPLFPGFHARNLETNAIMSALAGVVRNPVDYFRLIYRAGKDYLNPQRRNFYRQLGILTGRQGEEATGRAARDIVSEKLFQGPKPKPGGFVRRLFGQPENIPVLGRGIKLGYKAGDAVEGISRIAHYLGAKSQGMGDFEAVKSVRTWLFDYTDLSPIESKYIRQIFLFYPFMRKVIPRLFGTAIEHPGKASVLTRASTQPTQQARDVPLPEFIRQSLAIPAGSNAAGDPRYLTGVGSPLENLSVLDLTSPEGGALGAGRKALRNLGLLLNPALKVPAEFATGKDLYTDQPIIDRDKAPIAALLPGLRELLGTRKVPLQEGGTRIEADPMALYLLQASPFSRLLRTGGQLADVVAPGLDPRTSTRQQLATIFAQLKIASIDPVQRKRAAAAIIRSKLLGDVREGKAGQFNTIFATGPKGEKDPEVLRRTRQLSALQRRLKTPTN